MNNKNTYIDFSKDLLCLYRKIKHSEIEECYIKIASSLHKHFFDWILNKSKPNFLSKIKSENTYNCLKLLSQIRKQVPYGSKLDNSFIVKNILFENQNLVSTLWSLKDVLRDVRVSGVLSQFEDLIISINNVIAPKEDVDPKIKIQKNNDVVDDIIEIYKEYEDDDSAVSPENAPKLSLNQKRSNMLRLLLSRFSNNIASSYEKNGMTDVAAAIRGGVLAKYPSYGIDLIIDSKKEDMVSSSGLFSIKSLVDQIYKKQYDERWLDYNYSLIDVTFLKEAGIMSKSDFFDIIYNYEKDRNILNKLDSKRMVDPIRHEPESAYVDQRMNPKYIYLLCTFFVTFSNKI